MSSVHIDRIDAVADLLRDTLTDLRAGQAPDLEAFAAALDSRFEALTALGPIDPTSTFAARCRTRLEEVESLRTAIEAGLGDVREETRRRLGRITNGRRTIGVYRSSFEGGRRGTHRGEG